MSGFKKLGVFVRVRMKKADFTNKLVTISVAGEFRSVLPETAAAVRFSGVREKICDIATRPAQCKKLLGG